MLNTGAGQTLSLHFTPDDTADYNTADKSVTINVSKAAQTISFTQPASPVVYGSTAAIPLTATGGSSDQPLVLAVASGPATLSGTTLTITGAGSIVLTANQAGNSNFEAATQVQRTVVVSKASATLTAPSSAVPVIFGQSGSVPVSIAGQYRGTGIMAPSGSISYTITNVSSVSVASGSLNIADGGVTVPVANTLAPGQYTVSVTYVGDSNYDATSVTANVRVGQIQPAITWAPAATRNYGSTLAGALNAQAYDGANSVAGSYAYLNGASSVSSSTVLPAGMYVLTVNFTPNDTTTYKTATSTATVTVNKIAPSVVLQSSGSTLLVQNPITLTATVSSSVSTPSGTVTFLDGATPLGTATLTNGVAALTSSSLTVGSHSITAVYGGDSNFVTVTGAVLSEQVQDFTLTLSSASGGTPSQTTIPGESATYNFTLSPSGATFPAAINLSVSGLPEGATATITPSTIAAGAGPTNVTLTVTISRTYVAMQRSEKLAPIALALLLLPFSRKLRSGAGRISRLVAILLLLAGGAAAVSTLTGCGTGAIVPKTYNLTVTGTSGSLTRSTNVTLVVSK